VRGGGGAAQLETPLGMPLIIIIIIIIIIFPISSNYRQPNPPFSPSYVQIHPNKITPFSPINRLINF
jgi:flagellar biosynthesis protein FlhB